MHRPPHTVRVLLVTLFAAIVAGIAVAVVVVARQDASPDRRATQPVQTSAVWKPGTTWDVTVRQDGGAIAPDRDHASTYDLVYHFRVVSAPRAAEGDWVLSARQDGAEGPFGDGFRLYYREADDGSFVLHSLALGNGEGERADAAFARGIVGDVFPLQERVSSTPRSRVERQQPVMPQGSAALPPPLPN